MAKPEHLKILKQGAKEWNAWRYEHREMKYDLTGADLAEWDLSNSDLRYGNLSGANLREANLRGNNLTQTNLSRADLRGADLNESELIRTDLNKARLDEAGFSMARISVASLVGASLKEANLHEVYFYGANLSGADFTHSQVSYADFADVDLSAAKGLGSVVHPGPSTIGIDTIYKSKGNIPENFLRGCGVPDDMIAYIRSIAGAVQFYSCFISYSTKDQEFADRLYADLQAKGVRCWFAPHDIRGGQKIHEQIDEAIRLHDKLLLILSKPSMSSDWVRLEIVRTLKRERQEKRQMLFPVALVPFDPVIKKWEKIGSDGKDLAEEIRQYPIPDFSNWKDHDSYQKAFTKLVADLKAQS